MKNKLSILFVIKLNKLNKKGLCPINTRLTYQKTRKEFSTGLFVKPEYWDAKKQLVQKRDNNSYHSNNLLMLIKQKINKVFLTLQLNNNEFDIDDISNLYFGKNIKKDDQVVNYFRKYLNKLKGLIDKDIQEVTWKKSYYVCNDLESFIQHKYNKKDISFNQLKPQFIEDFEYYLKVEKNQRQITINKSIQRFRKPIKVAVAEGSLDKDPFVLYKSKRVNNEVIFLTEDELKLMENYQFAQYRLQVVKDMFIFCCYTGLAYIEMANLKENHIQKGFDGNLWIKMTRQKTSKSISIPLLPQAQAIIDKYKQDIQLLPVISNQKFNSYLKEIALIIGVEKRLTHHVARKTFASTVLLFNDVPIEIVSKLLGHSSITITEQSYGKIVQKKVSEQMQKLMNRTKTN